MATKRKRSCNYTKQEITKLLELVALHRTSVEDKRCGAIYVTRKKEAWDQICKVYNSVASSGIRTVDQLRVLYDNKKQKARKSLAERNKSEYVEQTLLSHNVLEVEFKDTIKHERDDEGECSQTGGGSWCPTVTETDQKVLDLLKDQVTPLVNKYDSAATYFGDLTNMVNMQPVNNNIPIITIDVDVISETENINADLSTKIVENNKGEAKISMKQSAITPSKKRIKKNNINYKQLYFKRKAQNAYLERRRIYQEIRLRQKEHAMLAKEHELKVRNLEIQYNMGITSAL